MCNREVFRRLFFLTMLITSEVPARNRVDQMLPTTGGKVILQCNNRHDLQVEDWFRLRTLKKEDGGRLLKATANRLITVQGRTKMKRKMIVVGCMMMLALITESASLKRFRPAVVYMWALTSAGSSCPITATPAMQTIGRLRIITMVTDGIGCRHLARRGDGTVTSRHRRCTFKNTAARIIRIGTGTVIAGNQVLSLPDRGSHGKRVGCGVDWLPARGKERLGPEIVKGHIEHGCFAHAR